MLNQDVICPHCQVPFRLRERDSVEYQRKKATADMQRVRRIGNAWFHWAVIVAALVLTGLILLVVSSSHG